MTTKIYEGNGKQIVEFAIGDSTALEIWADPWRLDRHEAWDIGWALLTWTGEAPAARLTAAGTLVAEAEAEKRTLRDEIAALRTENAALTTENEKLARAPPGLEERKVKALERIADALRDDGVIDQALYRIGTQVTK